MALPQRGCASGGFSERKSLLFHPKSASGPLQGQGLAQQNASRRDEGGNSHDGVGEEKADGSGASVFPHGEPGSCGPSEWGSLSWRESSHPKPGRALFSPQGSRHLASPPPTPLLSCCPCHGCAPSPAGKRADWEENAEEDTEEDAAGLSSPCPAPSLLLPQLLPCCLPAKSRRPPCLGPPSLPTSLGHGSIGGDA